MPPPRIRPEDVPPPITAEERDDRYRAVGRYVVEFSGMVRLMRDLVCGYVARDSATGPEVSNILLGEASAQLIANALFGMCRWKGDLSADEGKVARTLSNEVNDAIKTRNDFAHGDWIIAPSAMQEGRIRSLDARIIRILPARSEGPTKVMDLSVDKLDGMSDRLIVLTGLLEDFAKLALKFLVLEPLDEGGQETRGKYRVSDVLTPVHGKGKAARVARDGPHAERLTIGPHSTYGRCAPFWAGSAGHR